MEPGSERAWRDWNTLPAELLSGLPGLSAEGENTHAHAHARARARTHTQDYEDFKSN